MYNIYFQLNRLLQCDIWHQNPNPIQKHMNSIFQSLQVEGTTVKQKQNLTGK